MGRGRHPAGWVWDKAGNLTDAGSGLHPAGGWDKIGIGLALAVTQFGKIAFGARGPLFLQQPFPILTTVVKLGDPYSYNTKIR
jgi:hypothetical protein